MELLGATLGKYQLTARLGKGGMAEVYQAVQPGLGRPVAVKVMLSSLAQDPDFAARFEREAAAIARLRHPNIVQVYDFDTAGDIAYMVLEFIAGPTLQQEIAQRRQAGAGFTDAELVVLFNALGSALDYAHARGMVHRDIKPSNIMFTAERQVVLTDFGLAKLIGGGQPNTEDSAVGTPHYMSPEQAHGRPVDARTDVYALGVVLFELVTGRVPFDADNGLQVILQHLQTPPPAPRDINPQISAKLEAVILTALSKSPADRFGTAGQLAEALRQALDLGSDQTLFFHPAASYRQSPSISTRPTVRAVPTGPFQTPASAAGFVGRQAEIAQIEAGLETTPAAPLIALCGLGGIGKTALAIQLAHLWRERFPDGVLWSNAATSEPLAVLDSWARALGYDFSGQPDLASRAAAWRGALTHKRVLVVIDDIWEPERARPLLPSAPGCAALLTTRSTEVALTLTARLVSLPVLQPEEGRSLLAGALGEARVEAEPAAAADIGRLLGYLPLALGIAAQRLASRPRWRLADLADRLRDEAGRLDELRLGDQAVRASFAASWSALGDDLRRVFAQLAVFEGRPHTAAALAAAAHLPVRAAGDALDTFAALSLTAPEGAARYRQHPLLAVFAREKLGSDTAVYQRMIQYYLQLASKHGPASEVEAEWDNVLAGLRLAYRLSQWTAVAGYVDALAEIWFQRGFFAEARRGYAWAVEAAEALDSPARLADYLGQWGRACLEQSDYAEAEALLQRSLEFSRALNSAPAQAAALFELGRLALERAQYSAAEPLLSESRTLREAHGDQAGVAACLTRQARVQYYRQAYAEAEHLLRRALTLQDQLGDPAGRITPLRVLAETHFAQGALPAARAAAEEALRLCENFGARAEEASTLQILTTICERQDDFAQARRYGERARPLLESIGDRRTLAMALYGMSQIDYGLENWEAALETGLQSLQVCEQLEDRFGGVYVQCHLAAVYGRLGRPAQAAQTLQLAWKTIEALADPHPLREQIRQRLASIQAE